MPREGFEPSIPRSSVSPISGIPINLVRSYPLLEVSSSFRATPPWQSSATLNLELKMHFNPN